MLVYQRVHNNIHKYVVAFLQTVTKISIFSELDETRGFLGKSSCIPPMIAISQG